MSSVRLSTGLVVIAAFLTASVSTAQMTGDYNNDGVLDAEDLDLQAIALMHDPGDPFYDLNEDGVLDYEDRRMWVNDLKNTWIGDANLDLEFNSSDFVHVFQRGKYETTERAGWEEGDWIGDFAFHSSDMVAAFYDGGYEKGPRTDVAAVPEPAGYLLLFLGAVISPLRRRRRQQ